MGSNIASSGGPLSKTALKRAKWSKGGKGDRDADAGAGKKTARPGSSRALALAAADHALLVASKSSKSNKSKKGVFNPQRIGPAAEQASAEDRMREAVRAQGRLTKMGGVAVQSGAGEFQLVGGGSKGLESLVNAHGGGVGGGRK